jgi:hypothetical protein
MGQFPSPVFALTQSSLLSPYESLSCDIRFFRVSFPINLVAFQASGGADPPPAEHLKPYLTETTGQGAARITY